jgi:O-antigen ligase
MSFVLPLVAALVPVLILPGWSFYFDVVPKAAVILLGAAVALLLMRRQPPRMFAVIVLAQAAAIVIAAVFSTHRWISFYGSTWRKSGVGAELAVLALALAASAADRITARNLLRASVLAGLPVALYGILQYFGIDPILNAAGYHFGEGRFTIVRPPSTLGHAAYFATYLLYVVFAGLALAASESGRIWKAMAAAASAVALLAIVLSGTRAALAGLAVGAVFAAVRGSISRKWVAATIVCVIAVAGLYVSPAGQQLRARVFWSTADPAGGARLMLWRDTAAMLGHAPARWVTGFGPETFSLEFPRHQSIALARAYPDFYHESPHNIFLDAAVSIGLLGAIPLLALAALGLSKSRGAMGAAFAAMLVSQQFTTFTLPTSLYFFLTAALLFRQDDAREVAGFRWLRLPVAVCFAGFAIYLSIGDALLGAARSALDHAEPARAFDLMTRARGWNAAADVYFSRRFVDPQKQNFEAWQRAMNAASYAPQTADDPQNAFVNLAAFHAIANDARGVELDLREAIAIAPNWYKPRWLLAQVLWRDGRLAEAETEARAAVDRDGGKHAEVREAWEQLRQR